MEAIALPHGHIVLPSEISRRLGLETGARLDVEFDEKTGCITLRPVHHEKYSFERQDKGNRIGKRATRTRAATR